MTRMTNHDTYDMIVSLPVRKVFPNYRGSGDYLIQKLIGNTPEALVEELVMKHLFNLFSTLKIKKIMTFGIDPIFLQINWNPHDKNDLDFMFYIYKIRITGLKQDINRLKLLYEEYLDIKNLP